ncbi:MAG: hypothetical protein GY891_03865 [Bacteroidetes bacterium]|nr:hypothetical protein [Bacteroidota bacterium]
MKYCFTLILLLFAVIFKSEAQNNLSQSSFTQKDSVSTSMFSKALESGYIDTEYFNFDLRYLIKYNQYEGFRTGLGGVTNSNMSNVLKFDGYLVYGFLDEVFKFRIGSSVNINRDTNTWLSVNYTEDLQEIGSSKFITDQRFFQLFEPRLLNIESFYKHLTKAVSIEHQISENIYAKAQFKTSDIDPKIKYSYNHKTLGAIDTYRLSLLTIAAQINPKSSSKKPFISTETSKLQGPKVTVQYTKSFSNLFKSDLSFSKIDLRAIQFFNHPNNHVTEVVIRSGLAKGDIPISHTYHAYPNNVNKETILQRFSVAGTNSFETMFFNEFFSDKFASLQLKHRLNPINISPWLKPEIVLIYRYALGNMSHIKRHEFIRFNTLDKGYSEAGLEINKLFFGFGLSVAYRHGAYHLPDFEDNFALKFTFNLNLNR